MAAQAVALGLWTREPGLWWAVPACAIAIWVAAAAARTRRVGVLLTGVVAVAAAVAALSTSLRVRGVERGWPEMRESLIEGASQKLDETLGAAVDLARSLAARAAEIETTSREEAFALLEDAIEERGPQHGVVMFDAAGRPWSWAGRHRVQPVPGLTELSARITPFYVVLEARRQAGLRSAVAHVVLAADSAVPDRDRTVAARFVRQTGAGLEFYEPGAAPFGTDVFDYCLPSCTPQPGEAPPDTLFTVRTVPPAQGSLKLELMASGGRWGAVLVVALLVLLMVVGGSVGRWTGALELVAVLVLTPTGQQLGAGPLFSSAIYFLDALGPLSASAGAMLLFAAIAVVALVQLGRRGIPRSRVGMIFAGALVLAAPYVMWTLARGITPPATGTGVGHWLSWQATLAVVGVGLMLGAALLLGRRGGVSGRAWLPWAVAGAVLVLVVVGLAAWRPGGWPLWYGVLWMPAVLLAIQPAPRARLLTTAVLVAGGSAALLTWGATVRGRLLLAERDAQRLQGGDPVAIGYLERFGGVLSEESPPRSAAALYASWRRSPLSQDDYPAVLATWSPEGLRVASLELADLGLYPRLLLTLAESARDSGRAVLRSYELEPGKRYVIAVPYSDGTVATVGVAPRSRLIRPVLVGRFLRGERRLEAPYEMSLGEPVEVEVQATGMYWERSGWRVRGTQPVALPGIARHLYVVVPLKDPSQLLVRGALLVFLDVLVLGLLWLVGEVLSGTLRVPVTLREIVRLRSYRIRLTIALAAFFVVPTLGFAAWSIGRLRIDAVRSRDLLVRQTLSDAAGTAREVGGRPPEQTSERLNDLSERIGADLMWYEAGVLIDASTAVLAQLGLLGTYLPPTIYRALVLGDELEVTADAMIGGHLTRVGYRRLGGARGVTPVLAVPRLVEIGEVVREQEDLAFGLLLATLVGLGGAAGLAAVAARSLARPVQSLRVAAEAVGRGDPLPPFGSDVPTEFASVVDAFERMAHDVEASQAALEAARRRTATVLRNVATGVVALDRTMLVTIANPRAGELLRATLEPGTPIAAATASDWLPVWEWVLDFMRVGEELDTREFAIGPRRIRVQVASLQADPRGCVVALDDMTELTHAVRVLAWGELARQIAHEVKNPLTPIRLGVQHLQRARRHGRADFDATLERTSRQILAEIERLDAIARAFSRFGAPQEEAAPLVSADLAAIARDAAALYTLGGGANVRVEAEGVVEGLVRPDEVKEVLVNLIENARDAAATQVTVTVRRAAGGTAGIVVHDDGRGITAEHLVHIFEPQFSTTSSGTGLGLAICKRLVESWGGTIEVESAAGEGTTVRILVGGGPARQSS